MLCRVFCCVMNVVWCCMQYTVLFAYSNGEHWFAQDVAQKTLPIPVFHSRIEETESLAKGAINICESIGSHKVESDLNLSMNPIQEVISREKNDCENADQEILRTVNSQLKSNKSARQQSDQGLLDELNVTLEEHLQNYFAEKSNDDLHKRKSNVAKEN